MSLEKVDYEDVVVSDASQNAAVDNSAARLTNSPADNSSEADKPAAPQRGYNDDDDDQLTPRPDMSVNSLALGEAHSLLTNFDKDLAGDHTDAPETPEASAFNTTQTLVAAGSQPEFSESQSEDLTLPVSISSPQHTGIPPEDPSSLVSAPSPLNTDVPPEDPSLLVSAPSPQNTDVPLEDTSPSICEEQTQGDQQYELTDMQNSDQSLDISEVQSTDPMLEVRHVHKTDQSLEMSDVQDEADMALIKEQDVRDTALPAETPCETEEVLVEAGHVDDAVRTGTPDTGRTGASSLSPTSDWEILDAESRDSSGNEDVLSTSPQEDDDQQTERVSAGMNTQAVSDEMEALAETIVNEALEGAMSQSAQLQQVRTMDEADEEQPDTEEALNVGKPEATVYEETDVDRKNLQEDAEAPPVSHDLSTHVDLQDTGAGAPEIDEQALQPLDRPAPNDPSEINTDDMSDEFDNVITQSDDVVAETGAAVAQSDDVAPETGAVVDLSDDIVAETGVIVAQSVAQTDDLVPEAGDIVDQPADILYKSDDHVDLSDDVVVQSNDVVSETDDVAKSDDIAAQSDEVIAEFDDVIDKVDTSGAENDIVNIQSDAMISNSSADSDQAEGNLQDNSMPVGEYGQSQAEGAAEAFPASAIKTDELNQATEDVAADGRTTEVDEASDNLLAFNLEPLTHEVCICDDGQNTEVEAAPSDPAVSSQRDNHEILDAAAEDIIAPIAANQNESERYDVQDEAIITERSVTDKPFASQTGDVPVTDLDDDVPVTDLDDDLPEIESSRITPEREALAFDIYSSLSGSEVKSTNKGEDERRSSDDQQKQDPSVRRRQYVEEEVHTEACVKVVVKPNVSDVLGGTNWTHVTYFFSLALVAAIMCVCTEDELSSGWIYSGLALGSIILFAILKV